MGLSAWQITEETSLLAVVLSDFARNRTRPMMKSNTFPLPETHPKATANDGRGLSCVEKKGGENRPVRTIARAGLRPPLIAPRPVLLAVVSRNRRSRGSRCLRVLNTRQHGSSPVRFCELNRGEIGAHALAE